MDFKETASNNSLKNSRKRKYFLSPCNMKYFRLFTVLAAPFGLAGQRLPYEHLYWHSSGPNLFVLPVLSIPYVSPVKGVNHYKIKMGAMHLSVLHPLMRRSDLAHWESLSFVVVIVKAEVAHVKSSQILCLLVLNKVLTELSTTACSMSVNTVE